MLNYDIQFNARFTILFSFFLIAVLEQIQIVSELKTKITAHEAELELLDSVRAASSVARHRHVGGG